MKYNSQVEEIYKKFIQNTACSDVLNPYHLNAIKNYFQKCWETGYAQGHYDGFNRDQSHKNDNHMTADVKFIDDICEALNS